jgi:predicted amidohydrolase
LFNPGAESDHYSAGDHLTMFRWADLKVAVFICYDLRFPETFRLAGSRGAQVMVVIANWPDKRHSHWLALLRARAIENQVYVVGVNRCGRDPKLGYAGGTLIIDPQGNIVASAGRKESIVSAKLDSAAVSQWRSDFPVLKDIRADIVLRTQTAMKRRKMPNTAKKNRAQSRLSAFAPLGKLNGRA